MLKIRTVRFAYVEFVQITRFSQPRVFSLLPHTPLGRVRLERFARVSLSRHTSPFFSDSEKKKPTVLQSMVLFTLVFKSFNIMCSDLLDQRGTNQPQRHGLNSVQRQYLIKELTLLNASGSSKRIFLNSHHKNSSKDFVMFVQSTPDSAVEVNKAPKEQKEVTAGGVVATSGLHFQDQLTER